MGGGGRLGIGGPAGTRLVSASGSRELEPCGGLEGSVGSFGTEGTASVGGSTDGLSRQIQRMYKH
jgi:hypothetical protein